MIGPGWLGRWAAVVVAALPLATLPAPARAAPPALVLLVGDSTLAPQTGYGDALCQRLAPAAACLNLGRGGRSTASYRAEGLWDRVLTHLRAREAGSPAWVLIQFGHNDQPGKPGRSTDLATEFPANLARYVAEVHAAGGTPVLLTPLTRRSFRGGALVRDLQPWADATRAVAQAEQLPWVDLHQLSADAVQALGPDEADLLARAQPGSAGFDRTHLGERGACLFAGLVADALARQVPALATPASGPDCSQGPSTSGPSSPRAATHRAFGMACFAQLDDRRFKRFMAAECAADNVHFALLGRPTAVASTSARLLRSLASLRARRPVVGLALCNLWALRRLMAARSALSP